MRSIDVACAYLNALNQILEEPETQQVT